MCLLSLSFNNYYLLYSIKKAFFFTLQRNPILMFAKDKGGHKIFPYIKIVQQQEISTFIRRMRVGRVGGGLSGEKNNQCTLSIQGFFFFFFY